MPTPLRTTPSSPGLAAVCRRPSGFDESLGRGAGACEERQCEALLAEAKALNINISQAAEAGLAQAVALPGEQRWLAENKAALESSNAYVETHGLPLARYRTF